MASVALGLNSHRNRPTQNKAHVRSIATHLSFFDLLSGITYSGSARQTCIHKTHFSHFPISLTNCFQSTSSEHCTAPL